MDFNKMTTEDKYHYLRTVVYEAVTHSHTGRLLISISHCRNVALMLGGNYESLTKIQKFLLRADITDERVIVESGIEKYLKY